MSMTEKKKSALGLLSTPAEWEIDEGLILSVGNAKGRFDEVHHNQTLFFRADSRPPSEVMKTGFSAAARRANLPFAGRIIWRCSDDDILHESAVSIARDIRGACFFPFTEEKDPVSFYLYAVAPSWSTSTYRAQQVVEAIETNTQKGSFAPSANAWRGHKTRWKYDPAGEDHDGQSCVWQFQEHATLEIPPTEIVGAWSALRENLVSEQVSSRERAGIRFCIETKGAVRGKLDDEDLWIQAREIVKEFSELYPKKRLWLSFQGIIQCSPGQKSFAAATSEASQLEAIVVTDKTLNSRGQL